ncbi:MAG: MerR family transcriptional regulator [Alphaproteobacteria bacterium]|nr:MerR family transcriptional regulator [Alphaproteobacteria bacterium SS10]
MSESEAAAEKPKKSAAKKNAKNKTKDAFRTISEVSEELDVPQHVLRFWETKFTLVKPLKRAGGRRYYRPQDLELLREIQRLLHDEGYTIKGVQKVLKSARGVASGIEKAREVGVQQAADDVTEALTDGAPEEAAAEVKPATEAPAEDAAKAETPVVPIRPKAVTPPPAPAASPAPATNGSAALAEKADEKAAAFEAAAKQALDELKALRGDIDKLLTKLS